MEARKRTDRAIAKPIPMLCDEGARLWWRCVSRAMGEAEMDGRMEARRRRSDVGSVMVSCRLRVR